ncbi:MAG: hypothetical protein PHC61_13895, partial [Chitinivibrionales bacterium]|nr:hypothetical protein [Chitinivibrionales bacterium]
LEENDLKIDMANANAMAVNELIGPFNDALNRKRPDFKNLNGLLLRMKALDGDKAFEMENAIDKHNRIVSRNVVNSFEMALQQNNDITARAELTYCLDNQGFLSISLTQYGRMAAAFQARSSAAEEQAFIITSLKNAETQIALGQIGAASEALHVAQTRLDLIRDAIIRVEADKLSGRLRSLRERVAFKEDSLVKRNLAILENQGIEPAGMYLDSVVSPRVADRNKVARVSEAIMHAVEARRAGEASPVSAEIAALTSNTNDTASPLTALRAQAHALARERAANRRKAAADSGLLTQADRVRLERMHLAQEGVRKREQEAAARENKVAQTNPEEVRSGRLAVAREGMQNRSQDALTLKRTRARKNLVEIYTLLEQNRSAEASRRFNKEQKELQEFLPSADYDTLAARVTGRIDKQ